MDVIPKRHMEVLERPQSDEPAHPTIVSTPPSYPSELLIFDNTGNKNGHPIWYSQL